MKKIKICLLFILFIVLFSQITLAFSGNLVKDVEFEKGIVSAQKLNIRSGPSTNFKIVKTLEKLSLVDIIAKYNDWYIIQSEDGTIGSVHSKYIQNHETYLESQPTLSDEITVSSDGVINYSSTDEELELINKINSLRASNNLPALEISAELQNTAKLKALDLLENDYFSHNSAQYGDPFQMLEAFHIPFNFAAENISGNSSIDGAIDAWKASENHLNNILNPNYKQTGIGIVPSPKYGKILVQLFTD